MKINVNTIVDPYDARVVVHPGVGGKVAQAHFDLVGLPRVEPLLAGKTPQQALYMTEHLCGICPAAHHLAGVRALDHLVTTVADGSTRAAVADGSAPYKKIADTVSPSSSTSLAVPISQGADLTRRLLHYGSHIEQHALRFAPLDHDAAVTLRQYGKAAMSAAGSPGHFPVTAVPGGVRERPDIEEVYALLEQIAAIKDTAQRVCALSIQTGSAVHISDSLRLSEQGSDWAARQQFLGANVALADHDGSPDLLGSHVKAVGANGECVFLEAAGHWQELVVESDPGATAPRPYLKKLGSNQGLYRVGPVAQLSIGPLVTPLAHQWQREWLGGDRHALSARAVLTLHCVEAIERSLHVLHTILLQNDTLWECADNTATAVFSRAQTVTGLVDSPRGILEHTYTIGVDGLVHSARILTPTVQNEPWLAALLTAALTEESNGAREAALEESIREADPCLPISSAPPGAMELTIDMQPEPL